MVHIFLISWLVIVAAHAFVRIYLYPIYFGLNPVDKVNKGYLRWSENFKYRHSVITLSNGPDLQQRQFIHYRIDIQLKGLYRALFRPLDFNKELSRLNEHIADVNAIDCKSFSLAKRGVYPKGKLIL